MGLIKKIAAVTALTGLLTMALPVCASAEKVQYETQILSEETTSFYKQWKEKYLIKNNYVTDKSQYYVWYSEEKYSDSNRTVEVTVSEAHGYGMLIAASMADYDTDAKEIFDGMYWFYKDHLSGIGPNLMAGQQCDNGSAIVDAPSGEDSATDGDMDIAYALLMADKVWGSNSDINYKQAAVDVINDIMEYEVNKTDWLLQLGDWVYWSDKNDKYYSAARASDFIVQYMPVFAEVTGDDRWNKVYDSTYAVINDLTSQYKTGILPDFIIKDSAGKFVPAPADFLESAYDGYYYYNSCRTPWRISMDYLINGNSNALAFAEMINSFIISSTGGDPWEIKAGYKPDGTPFEDYNDLCFTAPFLVSAVCGNNNEWYNEVRDVVVNYGDDVYFGDTIKMLCMIVADGGWIVPDSEKTVLIGDINLDGSVTLADSVLLQKFLLKKETLSGEQAKAADINNDGTINCFDWILLKRIINL